MPGGDARVLDNHFPSPLIFCFLHLYDSLVDYEDTASTTLCPFVYLSGLLLGIIHNLGWLSFGRRTNGVFWHDEHIGT